jgi:hypothetical protein
MQEEHAENCEAEFTLIIHGHEVGIRLTDTDDFSLLERIEMLIDAMHADEQPEDGMMN